MITYKLKQGGVIECTGYTSSFTLQQLKDNIARSEKTITECEATVKLKKAIIDNVKTHNSFIEKMTPKMIHACHMFHEAMMEKYTYETKIKEFKDSIKKDNSELKEIFKQIPKLADKEVVEVKKTKKNAK